MALTGDVDIRHVLLDRLRHQHESDTGAVVLEELGLCRGQVFVDVTVVNGLLHGYEIKSDRDSLRRLEGQVALYSRVLDRATLVVASRHLEEASRLVPDWWEILVAETTLREVRLKRVRRGRKNPSRDSRALVELLWLDQALDLLAKRDAARGYRRRPRCDVWDRVCEIFDVEEIAKAVRESLKARSKTPAARESL